jgi:hypothetical protein
MHGPPRCQFMLRFLDPLENQRSPAVKCIKEQPLPKANMWHEQTSWPEDEMTFDHCPLVLIRPAENTLASTHGHDVDVCMNVLAMPSLQDICFTVNRGIC